MTDIIPRIEGGPGQSVSHIIAKGAAPAVAGLSLGWGTAILGGLALTSYLLERKPPRGEQTIPPTIEIKGSPVYRQRLPLGRAFLAGQEVYANVTESADGRYAYLDRAILLQSRACESIEGVWIDGQRAAIHRRPAVFVVGDERGRADPGFVINFDRDSRFGARIVIWEYFSATGLQGGSMRTAYPDDWTDVPRLTGFCWVHVRVVQDREGPEEELWGSSPDLQFLVKGVKATWPGQDTPTWTENAAQLRYFYRSLALGETEGKVDRESFDKAAAFCGETITQQSIFSPGLVTDLTDGRLFRRTQVGAADFAPGATIDRMSLTGARLDVEASGPVDSHIAHWLRNNRVRIRLTIPFDTPAGQDVFLEADDIFREEFSAEPSGEAFTVASYNLTPEQQGILEAPGAGDIVTARFIPVAPRYSINGLVDFAANPDSVEKEMDFCWQGLLIEHNQKSYYEAGQPAAPVELEVGGDGMKIIERGEFYTSPDLSDRINAVSVRADSSSQKDWREDTVAFDSAPALAEDDNVPLRRQLPPVSMVSDNATLTRLAAIALRQLRIFRGGSYRVEPGADVSAMSIRPGLHVLLTDPVQGIDRERFRITRTRIEADKSVSLFLREDPDGLYQEERRRYKTLDQPGVDFTVPPPDLSIDNITSTGIDVTGVGSRHILFDLEWGPVSSDGTYTRQQAATGLHYYALPYQIGNLKPSLNYRVIARWRTADGKTGRPAQVDFATSAFGAPPLVAGLTANPQQTTAWIAWLFGTFTGYKQAELRYGTGKDVGLNIIGDPNTPAVIVPPGSFSRLTGLTADSDYWVQVRFVNEEDIATDWTEATSLVFKTEARVAITGIRFDRFSSTIVQIGAPVNIQLPDAIGGVPDDYRLVGALPSGLNYNAMTKRITGQVGGTTAQTYNLTWEALNAADERIASTEVLIHIQRSTDVDLTAAPPMPEDVDNQPADSLGSFLVSWTSSGNFFTQIEWDYLESGAWKFEDRRSTYAQNATIQTQQRSVRYRYRVRHVSPIGTKGPWFLFS